MSEEQGTIARPIKIRKDLFLFDEQILKLADEDPFLQEYANIEKFRNTKRYIKTRFYKKLSALITMRKNNLDEKIDYMNGIQGMGKTTSLIYFVLQCLQRSERNIHYIDLDVIMGDKDKMKSLAENDACNSKGCLIIDHNTLENFALMNEIRNIFRKKSKIILMETGYTASLHACSFDLGKNLQLNEEEFCSIWNVSVNSIDDIEITASLLGKGREAYSFIKGRYILSPRLLKFILDQMMYGRSIADAFVMYEINQRNRIMDFTTTEDDMYSRFCNHTRALVHNIPENGEYIFPAHVRKELFLAINVFEVKNCIVSKTDLENDARLKVYDLEEGDEYICVSHLIPEVVVHWKRKLPCDIKHIIEMTEDQALAIMFQYGRPRKKFEDLLVSFQKEQKMAIYPHSVETTVYKPSKANCDVIIENHCSVFVGMCEDNFMLSSGDAMKNIETEFQKVEKNVAKCALLLKNHIRNHVDQSLLMHPGNLMGIDYFLYLPNKVGGSTPAKKLKFQNILYLIQVATGAKHNGEVIGRSLDVIKMTLSELDILVHVVIITSVKDESYRLQKCYFENISVINLFKLKEIFEKNQVLYKFIQKLAEKA